VDTRAFLDVRSAPVFVNQLCRSQQDARQAPTADIRLSFCPRCGHVFNSCFDPALLAYDPEYENSLHCSARFSAYAHDLAAKLADRYALGGKTVVELGCGSGDFLVDLCRVGGARGRGFDPSYPGPANPDGSLDVEIRREPFSAELADLAELAPDLLTCRHVLEHIDRPVPFLSAAREAIGSRETTAFFEVPNAMFTVAEGGIWDIIYEHCGYFTPSSLCHAFDRAGFRPEHPSETFDGQFLTLHARPAQTGASTEPEVPEGLSEQIDAFGASYREKIGAWETTLAELHRRGRPAAIWGAGSKGTTFLNVLPSDGVQAVVDINPRKHGMFVTGTGHEIVAPEALKTTPPDVVVVMNPIYKDEIAQSLAELGLAAEILTA